MLQSISRKFKRLIGTLYELIVTSNHIGTLMNLTCNLDAGECELILDNEHNGTKDCNDNKKLKNKNTVVLDKKEAAYRS